MKIIGISILRALCAIAVGALLVKYDETVEKMTMVIGVIFLLSGFFAIVATMIRRKVVAPLQAKLKGGEAEDISEGMKSKFNFDYGIVFVGIIGMMLGATLVFMPDAFENILIYALSAFLVLGALQQLLSLGMARRLCAFSLGWWVMPLLLLVAGCLALFRLSLLDSCLVIFIGCSMIVYGVVECVDSFKIYSCRKKAEKETLGITGKPDFSKAEVVDFEEVK